MRFRLFFGLILVLIQFGCSSRMERIEVPVSKENSGVKNLATIILTRPPTPLMRIGFDVYDGDKKIGVLYQNSQIVWKRKPGYVRLHLVPHQSEWVKFANSGRMIDYIAGINSGHPYILYQLTYEDYLDHDKPFEYKCGINGEDGRTIWFEPQRRITSSDLKVLKSHSHNNRSNNEKVAEGNVQQLLKAGSKSWDFKINWFIGNSQKNVTLAEGMLIDDVYSLMNIETRFKEYAFMDDLLRGLRKQGISPREARGRNTFYLNGSYHLERLYGHFVFNENKRLTNIDDSPYKILPFSM